MVDLAELFVELIPWADWATFAKNGADATNMAVLIARTHTGRRKLIAMKAGIMAVRLDAGERPRRNQRA